VISWVKNWGMTITTEQDMLQEKGNCHLDVSTSYTTSYQTA
jgi:hypothetical protein